MNDFNSSVFPLNVAFVINSPSNLIFSPVTDLAILVDLIMVGLPTFFPVCKLIIVRDLTQNLAGISHFYLTFLRV